MESSHKQLMCGEECNGLLTALYFLVHCDTRFKVVIMCAAADSTSMHQVVWVGRDGNAINLCMGISTLMCAEVSDQLDPRSISCLLVNRLLPTCML